MAKQQKKQASKSVGTQPVSTTYKPDTGTFDGSQGDRDQNAGQKRIGG